MITVPTKLPDVLILEPRLFEDERGFFMETMNARVFETLGLPTHFVQDNHSQSNRGVLRGLHYQIKHPQGKVVRVVTGKLFDVVVDLRKSSKTFGEWIGVELSADNKRQLWVPPGFAHGFYTLEDKTTCLYKCSDYYYPEHDRTVLWNDPGLAIPWPLAVGCAPIVSSKDQQGKPFGEAEYFI